MTKTLGFILSACLAACAGQAEVRYTGNAATPELVEIDGDPSVMVVANADEPVFYSESSYWLFRDQHWYRSSSNRGGWSRVEQPPEHVRRIDRPRAYVHYRRAANAPRTTLNQRPGPAALRSANPGEPGRPDRPLHPEQTERLERDPARDPVRDPERPPAAPLPSVMPPEQIAPRPYRPEPTDRSEPVRAPATQPSQRVPAPDAEHRDRPAIAPDPDHEASSPDRPARPREQRPAADRDDRRVEPRDDQAQPRPR